MQMYRSWGRNHRVNNKPSEMSFPDDHDLLQHVSKKNSPTGPPRRAVFGLPHNYYFSSTEAYVDLHRKSSNELGKVKGDRRASPLFIHLHKISPNEYMLIHLLRHSLPPS